MQTILDYLRWPLRTQGGLYQAKGQTEAQTSFTVKHFDTDSMGQLSGWVDRKTSQNVLGPDKGPVDMQLPESFFKDRRAETSLKSLPEGWGANRERAYRPKKASVKRPEASSFEQVFIWQPYTRETNQPFSNMPTVY